MVYASQHVYLTVHWRVQAAALEEGQFGIRIEQDTLPSETARGQIATYAGAFWSTSGVAIPSYFQLYALKWAIIQPNGLYPDGFAPEIHEYAAPWNGGGTSVRQFPLQVAHACSLTTDAPRGRAHRGRIYMPALGQNLDTTDRWPSNTVAPRALGLSIFLGNINSAVSGNVSVMSKIGTGTTRHVTGVAVGNRPDIQRRRAASIEELYSVETVAG